MMEKKRYIERERASRGIIGVFFGIILFLTIFSPFYLLTIRYHVGYVLKGIFDWIGKVSLMGGSCILIISVMGIFLRVKLNIRWVIIGIALLWIGFWSTGIDLLGLFNGSSQGSGTGTGYH